MESLHNNQSQNLPKVFDEMWHTDYLTVLLPDGENAKIMATNNGKGLYYQLPVVLSKGISFVVNPYFL